MARVCQRLGTGFWSWMLTNNRPCSALPATRPHPEAVLISKRVAFVGSDSSTWAHKAHSGDSGGGFVGTRVKVVSGSRISLDRPRAYP